MGNKGVRYDEAFKKTVCDFYDDHTTADTIAKFGISSCTLQRFRKRLGYASKPMGANPNSMSFQHEVCQFYENKTLEQTSAHFGIATGTISKWRTKLGYRNKHYNYNLYTQHLQPQAVKRQSYDFMMTKQQNGQLKGEVVDLKTQVIELQHDMGMLITKLRDVIDNI